MANARPRLIRARNAFRTGKDRLANLLGETIPHGTDELPLELTDKLEATPWNLDLTAVIAQAGRTPVVVDVDAFALQNAYELNYGFEANAVATSAEERSRYFDRLRQMRSFFAPAPLIFGMGSGVFSTMPW